MKKPLVWALSVMLLVAGNFLCAQNAAGDDAKATDNAKSSDAKPVVTVVFAGYDAMMSNIKTVGELAGRPEWLQMIQGGIALGTQGRGLKGLDKNRPWGVMVFAGENEDWPIQAFLPVDDIKALLKAAPAGPDGPLTPDDDGVYEIPAGPAKTFYLAQKGKWARAADSRDALKTAIDDPLPLIGSLAKKYLVAIRLSVKNIPQAARDKYMPIIRFSLEQVLRQPQGNESDDQTAARAATAKPLIEKIETMSKELDNVTLGFGLDPATNSLFVDVEVRAIPGSSIAKQCAEMKDLKTRFAGFLSPELGINLAATANVAEGQSKYYKEALSHYKSTLTKNIEDRDDISKDQQAAAKTLINDAFEVFLKTTELKKSDFGLKVELGDSGASVAAGAAMADGLKLETTIKRFLADMGKDHPEISGMVKLDVEKYKGLNFHVATLPINEEDAAKVFGKTMDVAFGINDSTIYLAAGKDPVATIKKIIDDSEKNADKPALPQQLTVSLTPIASFVAEHSPDDSLKEQAKKFADEVAKTPGKDHIKMTTQATDDSNSVRIFVEPGVIKALGAIAPGGPAAP